MSFKAHKFHDMTHGSRYQNLCEYRCEITLYCSLKLSLGVCVCFVCRLCAGNRYVTHKLSVELDRN